MRERQKSSWNPIGSGRRRALLAALACAAATGLAAGLGGCTKTVVQEDRSPFRPSSVEVELALGMNRLSSGLWDEAEEHFRRAERAAATDGERARVRAAQGGLAYERGHLDAAQSLLREALRLEPATADAWLYLARTRLAREDTLAALASLQEGRLQVPARADLEAELGLLHLDRGAFSQAALHLERAVARDSTRVTWKEALDRARAEAGIEPPRAPVERRPAADDDSEESTQAEASEGATSEAELERAVAKVVTKSEITRAELAAVLAVHGPEIRPWPGLDDLPPDARDHRLASGIAVALFAGWMDRFPDRRFHPDDPLRRVQVALLFEPQIARYPALAIAARRMPPEIGDVSYDHYARPAVEAAVSAGLLELEGERFHPEAPFSGGEAVRLARRFAEALLEITAPASDPGASSPSGDDAGPESP